MRFKLPNGRFISRNIEKYRIDWEGKSLSNIQYLTKRFLYNYWKFNIVYEEAPLPGTALQVDILNATKMIAVEIHGRQHTVFNKFFHNNSRGKFLKGIRNDMFKRDYLINNGFTLVEILEGEEKLLTKDWFYDKFGINL